MNTYRLSPIFLLALLAITTQGSDSAWAMDFHKWKNNFRTEAISKGITPDTFDNAFSDVVPNQRVIELDGKQPERTKIGFATYLKNVMSQSRIDTGRERLAENKPTLDKISSVYGVPPQVIVSLWGIETSYGKNTGGFDLVTALSTLAWEGRRAEFFKTELLYALSILQGGHIDKADFKGSWAGAMGQNQFMPSSWHRYAVDFDGDGHKDIWKTKADVFASAANYLHRNGWDSSLKWGWQIEFPEKTTYNKEKHTYVEWLKKGIHFKDTPPNIPANTHLTLVIPDGGDNRAYLVSRNFDVIMSWNRSTYFALTVGLLSDFVAQQPTTTFPHPAYNE